MNSEPPSSRLDTARRNLGTLRRDRARLVFKLAETAAELRRRLRQYGRTDSRTKDAHAAHTATKEQLDDARAREREARRALSNALSEALGPEPAGDVAVLSTEFPVALFPVRLETRFVPAADQGPMLHIRIYPDEIVADTHEPALTAEEVEAGRSYWRTVWQDPALDPESWRLLVAQFPATRAAWIVRTTAPVDLSVPLTGTLEFPEAELRTHTWTRAAETRVLPDRWSVIAYRNGREVRREVSGPVEEPLALTLSPNVDPQDPDATINISGDGLRVDSDVAWTFDFERAKAAGMAITMRLDSADLATGFDRVIVLGVKASLTAEEGATRVAELLDNHHYARGLAFVRQGTPTNNTSAAPAGFPPSDPGGSHSFAIERAAPLVAEGSDGAAFVRALGIPPEHADHVAGAERMEQRAARAMNDALWPCSLGYFLEQMMAPVFDRDAIAVTRRYFVDHVRGRGPLPAFRIGGTPYGLLPVSSLSRWRSRAAAAGPDLHLPEALRTLRGIWAAQTARVPRIGSTDDPDADLLAVLGMDASARQVRVRKALGREFQWNLLQFMGVPWADWMRTQQSFARTVLDMIGHPEWDPRIAGMNFAPGADLVRQQFVSSAGPSEERGLAFDYVRWIRTVRSVEELKDNILPKGRQKPNTLLYHLLRHAALIEYARIGFDLHVKHGLADERDRKEPEQIGIVPGTEDRPTVWQRFDRPVRGVTGDVALGRHLLTSPRTSDTAAVYSYRDSLRALEGLPTAELDRLLTETLDTCSHRVDAWITSLSSKRLEEMRNVHRLGTYLGGYGWVEDLRPEPPGRARELLLEGRTVRAQNTGGGYVHAPTMDHAAAAAILRNAYLTRTGDLRTPYAIDLSSARVRSARWLLDAVRQGQPLGAVLGYRIERALHDLRLDMYIEPLRRLYPAVATGDPAAAGPVEAVAARNVVDGLRLRNTAGRLPFGQSGLPRERSEHAEALIAEVRALDEAVDAVADLLMAESVYQIVRGNPAAAGASLDSMAKGVRPPDPEVAHIPRGGTTVTHRVAIVLGGSAPRLGPEWPVPTPRAAAEPSLDAWIGSLLGDPRNIRCRVTYADSNGNDRTREVTLAELQIRPLDVLAISRRPVAADERSELNRRVTLFVRREVPGISNVQVHYARDAAWTRERVRTFPEVLEVARALDALLAAGRALRAADLTRPDSQAVAALRPESTTRATEAFDALVAARTRLEGAITTGDLRTALANVALFGVPGAFPINLDGMDDDAHLELSVQATTVRTEIVRREQMAASTSDPVEKTRHLFGGDFLFLPLFLPTMPEELNQAVRSGPAVVGDTEEVRKWLHRAARVRTPLARWRKLQLYAEALGARPAAFEVAQLPHDEGARWVALPFASESDRLPSGRVSIMLHRPVAPAADAEWGGILIDEWTEVIPNKEETTGITFHYDDPGAEAAQAVLLAVPPTEAANWEFETLVDIVNETLDLAKLRAVDGDLLGMLGQLLPAVYLAANAANDTVATDFTPTFVRETTVSTGSE